MFKNLTVAGLIGLSLLINGSIAKSEIVRSFGNMHCKEFVVKLDRQNLFSKLPGGHETQTAAVFWVIGFFSGATEVRSDGDAIRIDHLSNDELIGKVRYYCQKNPDLVVQLAARLVLLEFKK